jgi:predicted RNase H-like HicB family nuclease
MLRYPMTITKEDGSFVVNFPDFPDAHTCREDRDEAK